MTNPYDQYTPKKPFLARIGPVAGWIALAVVILSIGYCGFTQHDIHGHKEGWSAVIIIVFILLGLWAVGIIHGRKKTP